MLNFVYQSDVIITNMCDYDHPVNLFLILVVNSKPTWMLESSLKMLLGFMNIFLFLFSMEQMLDLKSGRMFSAVC